LDQPSPKVPERGPRGEQVAQRSPTPHKSYFICCLPRTGSWLLSEALQSTGTAGCPREYFGPEVRRPFLASWGLSPGSRFADYLERVISEATTPNGILGIKVHWYQFEHLMDRVRTLRSYHQVPDRVLLPAIFPNLHFVHLMRRDRIGHAVSYARACETKLWWEIERPGGLGRRVLARTPRFSTAKLDRMLEIITEQERNWRRWFRQMGVVPLNVFYEDLAVDHEGPVRRILEFLEIPAPAGRVTSTSRLRKQADDLSQAWVRRYRRIRRLRAEALG
jgi:trehalose 2-sulfotransferase